jgi:hypothetical protein
MFFHEGRFFKKKFLSVKIFSSFRKFGGLGPETGRLNQEINKSKLATYFLSMVHFFTVRKTDFSAELKFAKSMGGEI